MLQIKWCGKWREPLHRIGPRFIFLGCCPTAFHDKEKDSFSFSWEDSLTKEDKSDVKSIAQQAMEAARKGIDTRGKVVRVGEMKPDHIIAAWILQNPWNAFDPIAIAGVNEVADNAVRGKPATQLVKDLKHSINAGHGVGSIAKGLDFLDAWLLKRQKEREEENKGVPKKKVRKKRVLGIPLVGKARWVKVATVEEAYAMGFVATAHVSRGTKTSVRYKIKPRSNLVALDLEKLRERLLSVEKGWEVKRGSLVTTKKANNHYSTLDAEKLAAIVTESIDNTKKETGWVHPHYGDPTRRY